MPKPDKSAADFHPAVLDAFDKYVHGYIDRREFLRRASVFAVGSVTAAGLLDALNPRYAGAQDIDPEDERIEAEYLIYPSPQEWQGYLVRPADTTGKRLPAILVIHENRGRNPYIEDVARRFAVAGFMAMAPDALTPFGGWPGNDDEGRALQRKLDGKEMFDNWVAAFEYLRDRPDSTGNVGAVGFCYGGGVVNAMAARAPDLAAAVPFYGRPAPFDEVENIRAPLMIHNAALDSRLMEVAPAYEKALREAGIDFRSFVYADAHHGFHNYSTPRYDETSAKLAERRTIDFFRKHLTGSE